MNLFQMRSKIWLEVAGKPFLGDGRYRILSAIHQHGSINAAAKALSISYRKVWAQLHAMEEAAPFSLLEKRTGGKDGGATHLTHEALNLLEKFEAMRAKVNAEADHCFDACFPDNEELNNG